MMFDIFLEASAILHTILGVLVGFLLLYLGNAWSASNISEKREAYWAYCWGAAHHDASIYHLL